MTAPQQNFGRLRELADVLRLSARTPAPLRPFAVELFRTQTAFNHRLVDVLEDAVWTFRRADHAASVEQRLGVLASAMPNIPTRRGGLQGQLIVWTKRVGLAGIDAALGQALRLMEQTNRAFVDALKSRAALPSVGAYREGFASTKWIGLEAWFEAQGQFYEAVAAFVHRLGDALTDFSAASGSRGEADLKARWPRSAARAKVQILSGDGTVDPQSEVVFLVPAGETPADGAVETVSELFAARPEVQLCYGDTFIEEDKCAVLRPGWSPEYQLSSSYIGGCFAMRTALFQRVGNELLKAQLGDSQVVRVPWVLSKRATREVVDVEGELRSVRAHLGAAAIVEQRGAHRAVRLHPTGTPLVTIIVPFRDKAELLRGLWSSLQRYDAGLPFELLLVSNQSEQLPTFEFLEQLRDPRVSWFAWDEPFNWSAINNAAAARAKGELLLFLNNDTEITHDGWLRDLAGYASHPQIGVAGARLLYADRSIQHAGVVIGLRGLAGHMFARWRPEYGPTPFGSPEPTRNWSAVTGACLMIRRALFEEVRGFDEGMRVSGGDIELCLRVRARGLRVVCVGHVELIHYESISRRSDPVPAEDIRREKTAYAELTARGDPYYHPQLSLEVGHGRLGL